MLVFAAVPAVLYREFEASDDEQQALLLGAVRDRGLVIARALQPVLESADRVPYARLGDELARYGAGSVSLKLLFQPARAEAGFFYVASAPKVEIEALQRERIGLAEAGVLDRLATTCQGDVPLAMRVAIPGGGSELVTSITPVKTAGGCWALVVSNRQDPATGRELGRAYWRSPEVRLALAIYVALAAITLGLFFGLWRSLERFGRLARGIADGQTSAGGFAARNRIPELHPVADAFDGMVETLRSAAGNIRRAAEDNAHAYKTPLAIIAQAVEPLRAGKLDTTSCARAAQTIEATVARLNDLIRDARRLDGATADLLDPPRDAIDLSALCEDLADRYAESAHAGRARVVSHIADGIAVTGGLAMLTEAIENVIDNAISFAPDGGDVTVILGRGPRGAQLTVADRGPGVAAENLPRIFDRYFSYRPNHPKVDRGRDAGNFGVGLWLVRRNIEALRGRVLAENRVGGGFQVRIELPLRR